MPTRPKISWSDLRGSTVGLWGLGVEGRANLRRLRALGLSPVLVDDHPAEGVLDGIAVLATGAGGLDALGTCEVVVKTPGISRYRPEVATLESAGVAVAGGLGLWLEEAPLERVVCITGTKGKSTTTALVSHLLNTLGRRCLVGGNIGVPPWDPELEDSPEFWAIETSSFQATDVATSPPVVAVTSLHPDHLDWHGDAETYMSDKLSLCRQPGAELTIADGSSSLLRAREDQLGPRVEWVDEDALAPHFDGVGLLGPHNRRNAAIARAIVAALGIAATPQSLADALASFEGLESRLQPIGRVGTVRFINDSLSTNPLAACAALDAFDDQRVALLVGGYDRGVDYSSLGVRLAERRAPTLIVTMPDNGPRIGAAIEAIAPQIGLVHADSLEHAVRLAYDWAEPAGVVLLSPAAPSFGRFEDYRARARAFADAMATLP